MIDLDEATDDRILLQRFPSVPISRPRARDVDVQLLSRVATRWGAFNAVSDDADRARRAIWHLQKASLNDDLVDQFTELWLALESLNGLLIDKYGLATSFVARSCSNCGEPIRVSGSSVGITYAIVHLAGGSEADAKRAREMRKTMQHGSGRVYQMVHRLPQLVPLLRDAAALAIADLLEVPAEDRESLRRQMYAMRNSPGELTVRGALFGLPVHEVRSRQQLPEFVLGPPPRSPTAGAEQPPIVLDQLLLGVRNHDGRWGDVTIDLKKFEDPERSGEVGAAGGDPVGTV